MDFEEGQVYSTGSVKFVISDVIYVTRYFSQLRFKLLDAGRFSDMEFYVGSKDLELGISLGEIYLTEIK